MAARKGINVIPYLERAVELLMELQAIDTHIRDAEAAESREAFPVPVNWPREPAPHDVAAYEMYVRGEGRLSMRSLIAPLQKLMPEHKWNQNTVRTGIRAVYRWKAMARLRELRALTGRTKL